MITSKKCWCGSGKSYDKCCKQIEQSYNPKLAQAFISKFGAHLTAQTWFADIVTTEIDRYYLAYPLYTSIEHAWVYILGMKNPLFLYSCQPCSSGGDPASSSLTA